MAKLLGQCLRTALGHQMYKHKHRAFKAVFPSWQQLLLAGHALFAREEVLTLLLN